MDTFLTIATSALIGFYVGVTAMAVCLAYRLDDHENWR